MKHCVDLAITAQLSNVRGMLLTSRMAGLGCREWKHTLASAPAPSPPFSSPTSCYVHRKDQLGHACLDSTCSSLPHLLRMYQSHGWAKPSSPRKGKSLWLGALYSSGQHKQQGDLRLTRVTTSSFTLLGITSPAPHLPSPNSTL